MVAATRILAQIIPAQFLGAQRPVGAHEIDRTGDATGLGVGSFVHRGFIVVLV